MFYDFGMLTEDIQKLNEKYSFIKIYTIGKSLRGRKLYVLQLGEGAHEVFYNGAHHALEWITSPLLMRFVEEFSDCYVHGKRLKGYNIRSLFEKSKIFIMPMVNPDGIELVHSGASKYSSWQSNARGVDLNHNYNAEWERFKQMESDYGIFAPGPTRYSGKYPESEPEVASIVDFVREHNIMLLLALHSQGEEIFWDFEGLEPPNSKKIAQKFSRISGYKISVPQGIAGGGGCKDWFIKEFRRPGFTLEVGLGTNPLPIEQFDKIYNDILEILLLACIV